MSSQSIFPANNLEFGARSVTCDVNEQVRFSNDDLADIIFQPREDANERFTASNDELFPDPVIEPVLTSSSSAVAGPKCRASKKRSYDVISDSASDVENFDDGFEGEDCIEVDANGDRRFRPYQAGQWSEKFEELCQYRETMGHCLVPHTYTENLALARWVKRQRYQYKLMVEGKSSTMTEERVKALEDIGFVWDSQGAAWGDRLHELQLFKKEFQHCNVPSNYCENPRLATWIKCQRRQYKLYMENKPSNMTPQRIHELEKLGFEWELRNYKKARIAI